MENINTNQGYAPQNYMTLSIISTLLGCCSIYGIGFIFGIIAIYFASQVNPRFNAGDTEGAIKNSKNARILSFIALGLFVLGLLLSLGIYLFYPELYQEQMEEVRQMMEEMGMPQE